MRIRKRSVKQGIQWQFLFIIPIWSADAGYSGCRGKMVNTLLFMKEVIG